MRQSLPLEGETGILSLRGWRHERLRFSRAIQPQQRRNARGRSAPDIDEGPRLRKLEPPVSLHHVRARLLQDRSGRTPSFQPRQVERYSEDFALMHIKKVPARQ